MDAPRVKEAATAARGPHVTLDLTPGKHEIVARAWDSSAATQPETDSDLWNPKGYINNARPRITVHAVTR